MYVRTLRELPAEAEIPSHILLLRTGMIRKLASGIYGFMPLGWRSLHKIENIIREEMDKSGAQEILMSAIHLQNFGRNQEGGVPTALSFGVSKTETAETSA